MRLIDADALTASVLKWLPPDPCGREEREFPFAEDICVSMLMEIEEAPTIEPRPGGKWEEKGIAFIRDTNIERVQEMRCSKCKRWLITPYRHYLTHHKFCPNCGADMREEE